MDEASEGSSIGEAVSGRGGAAVDEDDIYYIPERRPSLDLGTHPMELNPWYCYHSALVWLTVSFHKMFSSLMKLHSRTSTSFET